jgi:NADPH2:quinone reductase
MRAAVLTEPGSPAFGDFADPEAGAPGEEVIEVLAAGINHLDLAKAAGTFYTGPPPLPSVPGSDGVGRRADRSRVYFDAPVAPFGSLAERTLVASETLLPVPDAVDDATAAAAGNAGIAAMTALDRARLAPGERVLVLGATGTVGRIAVQASLAAGAARVVAAGRDEDRLRALAAATGCAVVALGQTAPSAADFEAAADGPVDVIVDPLWGEPALAAMGAAAQRARLVQLGQRAGTTIELPAALIRSRRLELIGVSGALESHADRAAAYAALMELIAAGKVAVELERVPLERIEDAWRRQAAGAATKLVVTP